MSCAYPILVKARKRTVMDRLIVNKSVISRKRGRGGHPSRPIKGCGAERASISACFVGLSLQRLRCGGVLGGGDTPITAFMSAGPFENHVVGACGLPETLVLIADGALESDSPALALRRMPIRFSL